MGRTIQNRQRREIAADIARDHYGSDDIDIADDPTVEYVDGGYWVPARLWVSADDVDGQL